MRQYLKVKTKFKFLFLEPFFGGSHREFAEGLISHSQHQIDLVKLPARFWKWRMRGAALYFVKKIPFLESYDGLLITGLMSLSDFKALSKTTCPPTLTYFHETQLTYPLAPGEHMDYQFGFTDITTALAANRVLFNSRTHSDAFFLRLPGFLKMMPEYRPNWVVDEIRSKAGVLYPGCRFPAQEISGIDSSPGVFAPLIIWNHRWEFDKNPDGFHSHVLYKDAGELVDKLTRLITNYSGFKELRRDLSRAMGGFAWENLIDRYDEELEKLACMPTGY